MLSQILLPIMGTLLSYTLYHAIRLLHQEMSSPLRHMVGPRSPSLIWGNFMEMANDYSATRRWRKEFGRTFLLRSLFSMSQLHTSDLKAINHIITHSTIYQKPKWLLENTKRTMGPGILSVGSDDHKRQRRVLNQAFGIAQVRALTETFIEKAAKLRDIWADTVGLNEGTATIDAYLWLSRATLDVIGQAGFNYDFDALEAKGRPNELNQVLTELLSSPRAQIEAGFRAAQALVPILKLVPFPGLRLFLRARGKMFSIGNEIVSKSKAAIQASQEKGALEGKRDLLSVLLKANMSPELPESHRLSDAEVKAQLPTFFIAGHETTSSAVSWALHALSLNTAVQTKLREELLTISTDNPTMEELNALPYLECVVRETMRAHTPVVFTVRTAMEDDVLPLSKPYVDANGVAHQSLSVPKGQLMHIPILAVNTDEEIWGDDAAEFKPERWDHVPDAANAVPGAWANLFTFFAGPHNCIGFRFSLLEIKAFLFTLLRAFEFKPACEIRPSAAFLQKPTVVDHPERGACLPLIVKPYDAQGL